MPPLLETRALSKRFGSIVVADAIDLTLERGECLDVIGPNGAGKSSLFALISGDLAPESGEVLLEGRAIIRLAPHKRARLGIGRAFQIPQPFAGLTVYENAFAASRFGAGRAARQARDKARAVLATTGLLDQANRPAGALTLLNRKRLELAKALAVEARLLMLDEIGAGLTEREVDRLVETIAALKADHAVIWIEHIAHALKSVADRIAVLHFGRKLLEGPPEQVMGSAVVKEIYMGLGVDVWPSRFLAYVASAAAVAAAGALSLLGGLVVQPGNAFSPDWTVVMTFVVIVGGIGTLEGPILGALIYFLLRQALTVALPLSGAWYVVAMGVVAVGAMLIAPRGLWPLIRDRAGADWLTVRRTI